MAAQTKEKTEEVETITEEENYPLLDGARRLLLASIGVIALAQDEIEIFINKLVERGQIAEKDGKKLVQEVLAKRKKDAKKAEDEFNKRLDEVLDRMNVPTKSDIDTLSKKISELNKKIDQIK